MILFIITYEMRYNKNWTIGKYFLLEKVILKVHMHYLINDDSAL